MNKVNDCLRVDSFKGTIDVYDMHTQILDEFLAELNAHRYYDLFMRGALCGHVDSWFRLGTWTIDDFLNKVNF